MKEIFGNLYNNDMIESFSSASYYKIEGFTLMFQMYNIEWHENENVTL